MYTSCPECGTVFRLSTHDLRVAEGFVRCGHCSATFNAIATLTDEPPATVTLQQLVLPTEPQKVPDTGEQVPDTGPDETPAPAPEEPPSLPGFPAEPAARAAPPELQAAATYVPLPVSDDTLEFDIPEDSWSNFFDAQAPAPVPPPITASLPPSGAAPDDGLVAESAAETESAADLETEPKTESESESESEFEFDAGADAEEEPAAPAPDVGTGLGSDTVDQAGLYKALSAETGRALDDDADWQALLAEVQDDAPPEPVYVIGEAEAPVEPEEVPLPEVAWDESAADDTRAPAPLPADFAPELAGPAKHEPMPGANREPSIADRPFIWQPPVPPVDRSGRHWGYTAGSVLAALLLLTQLLHQQREELATNPTLMEPLRRTYAALGQPLWPAWDLRSYELRTSEAVADRSSPGALDILGRIAVVGNDRVGLPLVRVTLRDRFGEPLGSRVFQPAEYLGRNTALREPVSPGTLIPVEISLKDPGRDAQGFDVDVCVMSGRDGVTCRADREPFAR